MKTLGIDEAGRGCLLGPMIIAGVLIASKKEENLLREWGVADSKTFGSQIKGKKIRAEIANKIKKAFPTSVFVLPSELIDQYVVTKSLNILEQEYAKKIIEQYPDTNVVLDGQKLFQPLQNKHIKAIDKADETNISVAAASILAKAERDRIFQEICHAFAKSFGIIQGGGYGNQNTLKFILWYLEQQDDLPPFYRKSYQWKLLAPYQAKLSNRRNQIEE